MRTVEHDLDRERPAEPELVFTPFLSVPLGRAHELRIDLTRKGDSVAVSCRHRQSKGRDRPLVPHRPMHVFPEHLPALIAGLTAAAAAIGALPDGWPNDLHPAPHGTRPRPT